MHEIKIYGYISNVAEQTDKEVSLLNVQQQLAEANGKDIFCRINSHGGDAEEGFAIYYELRRYAKDNKAKVKTFAESRLGSIATIIFLAGDERELTMDLQPFVHKASFETEEELTESQKNELNVLNARLANHYSQHTDLTFDEALELMTNETFIPTEMAKEMRFATSVESVLRPVAYKRFNNNKLDTDMNKNPKNQGLIALAKALVKKLSGATVNKVVMSADERELDFYELEENEVIEVGANVRVDGDDKFTGDVVAKNGDTYKIVDGVLADIIAPSDEISSEDAVALLAENEELTAQLEQVIEASQKEIETLNTKLSEQAKIIASYRGIVSASAPKDGGKQKEKETKEVSTASKAIGSFVNNNLLKK